MVDLIKIGPILSPEELLPVLGGLFEVKDNGELVERSDGSFETSVISKLSLGDLEKRLFFDFDDTIFRTGLLKTRVLFPMAEDMYVGLSREVAMNLYSQVRKNFSLENWKKSIDAYAQENILLANPDFPGVDVYFDQKFREFSSELIPEDTVRLIQALNMIGMPLNIVTYGNPALQARKIRMMAEVLGKIIVGTSPFVINVNIVPPRDEKDLNVVEPEMSAFGNIVLNYFVFEKLNGGAVDKADVLFQLADANEVVEVFYLNDKAEENEDIRRKSEAVKNGYSIVPYQIDRGHNGDRGAEDILRIVERIEESIYRLEEDGLLPSLSSRLITTRREVMRIL